MGRGTRVRGGFRSGGDGPRNEDQRGKPSRTTELVAALIFEEPPPPRKLGTSPSKLREEQEQGPEGALLLPADSYLRRIHCCHDGVGDLPTGNIAVAVDVVRPLQVVDHTRIEAIGTVA
jgi:hypothetical protein